MSLERKIKIGSMVTLDGEHCPDGWEGRLCEVRKIEYSSLDKKFPLKNYIWCYNNPVTTRVPIETATLAPNSIQFIFN